MCQNKELEALVSMLDEPSEEMYAAIKVKIIDYGGDAMPLLENVEVEQSEERLHKRVTQLIQEIRYKDVFKSLYDWARGNVGDLLEAALILNRLRFPETNEESLKKTVDKLTQDVWLEINDNLTPLEKIKVINHVFYDVYQYKGIGLNKDVVDGNFLYALIHGQEGNSLTISMLYIIVAQRLKLPIFGVNLPQHFILAYMDESADLRNPKSYVESDVIFYLNAMNKGAVFTQNEVRLYLKQMKLDPHADYYTPCDNITLVKRLVKEISSAYEKDGRKDDANASAGLLSALEL